MVIASALLLTVSAACSPSARQAYHLPALDPRVAGCSDPVVLDGELTTREVEQGWARDRVALVQCRDNLNAVVSFYGDLRTRLAEAAK